jgi:septal ring factor EnvC (AmiA/AmiB activator)
VHTAHGAPVTAPADGEIAYADVFRSYGRVLILNLDDGYAVVLAGLESAQVQAGQRVRAGQVIGAMPNSDNPAPELYVEVRRQGRPINPGPWLRARGVNAQSPNSQGLSAERVARNAG